jgi:recombination associated protein RdgC
MFFKNAITYTFTSLPDIEEDLLEERAFFPCPTHSASSSGFVKPVGFENLVNVIEEYVLLCLQVEERILPGEVVRKATDERVKELEEREARKIYRKERKQISEDLYMQFLPRAFTKQRRTHAVIDLKNNLIMIDASSPTKAEEFLNVLRSSIGSLPALPVSTNIPAEFGMTSWVSKSDKAGAIPKDFSVGEYCKLKAVLGEGTTYTLKDEPELSRLADPLIMENNMEAIELEMMYSNLVRLVLTRTLTLKGMKFADIQEEQMLEEQDGDIEAVQKASLLIWGRTVTKIIMDLCASLKGSQAV